MEKKRVFLALTLFAIVLFIAQAVQAGCCTGLTGCDRKNEEFGEQCAPGQVYQEVDCEVIPQCDIGICCHDQPMAHAMYMTTCSAIGGEWHRFGPFDLNPGKLEGNTNSICDIGLPACQYTSCEQENPQNCLCGLTTLDNSFNLYCCQSDNSVFSTQGLCHSSPSCAVTNFFSVTGQVNDGKGQPIGGASISAGGKTTITGGDGRFTIAGLPAGSAGIVLASKDGAVNSTVFNIIASDLTVPLIVLYAEEIVESKEKCDGLGIDDDGNQFNENKDGDWDPDLCDPACADYYTLTDPQPHATMLVQKQNFGAESSDNDNCEDQIDNDCDGLTDDADPDCKFIKTYCGDGVVQFPNADLGFEQCDALYDDYGSIVQKIINPLDGKKIDYLGPGTVGDDSRCPENCIAPGQPNECRCEYEGFCGNGIVDLPQEECDGEFDASTGEWLSGTIRLGEGVSSCVSCGTPNSATPCQCEVGAMCGDGVLDLPYETCDAGAVDDSNNDGIPDNKCLVFGNEQIDCPIDCRCPPGPPICGNNLIEPGEDCDGVPKKGDDSLSWETFKTNKFGCTASLCGRTNNKNADDVHQQACTCPESCAMTPDGPTIEKLEATYLKKEILLKWGETCPETNEFYNIYRCDAGETESCTPKDVIATISKDSTKFVDTTFDAGNMYCYMVQGSYTVEHPENSLAPKQSDFVGLMDKSIQCIKAGNEICLEPAKHNYPISDSLEFCEDNARWQCSPSRTEDIYVNEKIEASKANPDDLVNCNEGDSKNPPIQLFCAGPYPLGHTKAGKTECVASSKCDKCSDALGLFSKSYNPLLKHYVFGSTLDVDTGSSNKDCDLIRSCYLDYTNTNVDQFKTIGKDTTCYDFKSEDACKKGQPSDKSDTFPSLNCEWEYYEDYKELGIGVCRPKVIDDQKCELCHDPLNNVFGKCNKDMCQLYGNCYYDNVGGEGSSVPSDDPNYPDDEMYDFDGVNTFRCTNEKYISCSHYDSEEDCLGSDSKFSLDGEEQTPSAVQIDVEGNSPYTINKFNKIGGTNKIEKRSDDYFGFGKCEWVLQDERYFTNKIDSSDISSNGDGKTRVCVKNSDDSPEATTSLEDDLYFISDVTRRPDCSNKLSDSMLLACRKDNTSPITLLENLDIEGETPDRLSGSLNIIANVQDPATFLSVSSLEYAPENYPTTYACLAKRGVVCYPNGSATQEIGVNSETGLNERRNIIDASNIYFANPSIYDPIKHKINISGFYELAWFSEDMSHNLEEVRHATVEIDADAPGITFELKNNSFEIYEDIWRTNLSLTMNSDENAICSGELQIRVQGEEDSISYVGIQTIENINEIYNNTWSRNYSYLADGDYFYHYTCVDDVGNVAEDRILLKIEGDKSITNSLPRNTVNRSAFPLVLEVSTGKRAICKYLYSPDPIAKFEEKFTDPIEYQKRQRDLFENAGMTTFETTGDNPLLLGRHHSSKIKSTDSKFFRYYVRCEFPDEGRVKGNSGDDIKFAIDNIPPVTAFNETNRKPFNNWYNGDVKVALLCEDPLIRGVGMNWQFAGCEDNIYYCIGLDCKDYGEEKFLKYSLPFTIEETTNITFYSMDSGQNREAFGPTNTNIQFQIDKSPAKLDLKFFEENGTEEDVLRMGVHYKAVLNSTKPLMNVEIASPILELSSPTALEKVINFEPTKDPNIWEASFFIEFINQNKGIEENGVFKVHAQDYHNVSAFLQIEKPIDTKPPIPPVLEPSLEEPSREDSMYEQIGFPLHYLNGTYYTNKPSVFLTGYSEELLDIIATVDVGEDRKEIFFTQTPATKTFDDVVITGYGQSLKVAGDITSEVDDQMFFGLGSVQNKIGTMTTYGNYGKFYDITSLKYSGGDEQFTQANVHPLLEDALPKDTKIVFYDKNSPSFWFGVDVPLTKFENNTLFFKAFDKSGNIARYPAITDTPSRLTIYYDPVQPQVTDHFPYAGSTYLDHFEAYVDIRKELRGAELDLDSINFTINDENVLFSVNESSDDVYRYYRIWCSEADLPDGSYTFSVSANDYAGNELDESLRNATWTTVVDKSAPIEPVFELIGGNEFEGRWYVNSSPNFTLDFSANDATISVRGIALTAKPTANDAAECTPDNSTRDKFNCKFTPDLVVDSTFGTDYSLIIEASKLLDDGSVSNGKWEEGYEFTIDPYPPEVQMPLDFNHRIRDDYTIDIDATVLNEKHPLKGTIRFLGDEYGPASMNFNSTYTFMWQVNDYDKAITGEGNKPLTFELSDYAGNTVTLNDTVFLDLTPPTIENVAVSVSDSLVYTKEVAGKTIIEFDTARTTVTIMGDFSDFDNDIAQAWLYPGSFNESIGEYNDKTKVTLNYVDGVPKSFTVNATLLGEPGKTELNELRLEVKDLAGHPSFKTINIRKDLEAPNKPRFVIKQPELGPGQSPPRNVALCHLENSEYHTIEVSHESVGYHIAHGDKVGACEVESSNFENNTVAS